MAYAAPYRIGHDSNAPKVKAKKAVQAVERVHSVDATSKRRKRDKQGQAQGSPDSNVANGFLRATFLPKLEVVETELSPADVKRRETDFYNSLVSLAKHYNGFTPMNTRAFSYPYNIALSVWEAENYLKQHIKNWNGLRLVQDDTEKTFFISEEQYCTGTSLFYIPVLPLYRMLHERRVRKAARLLLSACTYLYHIADVPYYRQEDSYVYWEYEMISDWIEQDDEEEMDSRMEELKIAQWCGDRMEKKIASRKNLDVFKKRIETFRPENDFERECLSVASGLFSLYTDYPAASVFQHAKYTQEEAEEADEAITMRKYISFVADTSGWLYETLAECINNEFNECGVTEEPTIFRRFDGSSQTNCNLDFESRLFPLLVDLCYLLNSY